MIGEKYLVSTSAFKFICDMYNMYNTFSCLIKVINQKILTPPPKKKKIKIENKLLTLNPLNGY